MTQPAPWRGAWRWACLLACALPLPTHAGSVPLCDGARAERSAVQQHRLLQFTALVRSVLDAQPGSAVLIARSGLDLGRFGIRHSHAGIVRRASDDADGPGTALPTAARWSVRQLYFACDEGRPRLYDEGLAGYLAGLPVDRAGHVALVALPPAEAQALARAAGSRPQALALLGGTYGANAHPFDVRYQNCNQWVIEMLAASWAAGAVGDGPDARGRAQAWLASAGYDPAPVVWRSPLWLLAPFLPWLHWDDHPAEDLREGRVRVTLPGSIETFVRQRLPHAHRTTLCVAGDRAVVRSGWDDLPDEADGQCAQAPGGRVVRLDDG